MDLYACETRSIHMRLTASFSLLLLSVFVLWFSFLELFPSVLWCCWFGGRKVIRPVKNWVVGCWHGYLSWARCRLMAQLMPLPLTVSCFGKIRLVLPFWYWYWYWLTQVVPEKGPLNGCVCSPSYSIVGLFHQRKHVVMLGAGFCRQCALTIAQPTLS